MLASLAALMPRPPIHKMDTFVVVISPNEIPSGLVNAITNILGKPIYLHIVCWNGG